MSLKRLLPRCDTSRSNKAERPMAPIWAPLRGCLKSPGRSRLTVEESGFVPAASRVEWRNIVGENDGIGTFQTPPERAKRFWNDWWRIAKFSLGLFRHRRRRLAATRHCLDSRR